MDIALEYENGDVPVTVIAVEGSITVNNYNQLQQEAESAVRDGTTHILLDMTNVNLLSSSGLRAIHHIFNLLRSDWPAESDASIHKGMKDGSFKSPHLKILNPSDNVLTTLEMAGFDMFLEIYFDRRQALASY